jgi:hypothetical protein
LSTHIAAVAIAAGAAAACHVSQVAPNYPIVRTNLAVALTDLGTALKLKGQLQQGIGKGDSNR